MRIRWSGSRSWRLNLDTDGYPTDDELQRIKDWPFTDIDNMFTFVKSIWHWGVPPEWEHDGVLYLATGGWSGNEDISAAMNINFAIRSRWICSTRGGAHEYELTSGYHERDTRFQLERRLAEVSAALEYIAKRKFESNYPHEMLECCVAVAEAALA